MVGLADGRRARRRPETPAQACFEFLDARRVMRAAHVSWRYASGVQVLREHRIDRLADVTLGAVGGRRKKLTQVAIGYQPMPR